MQWFLFSFAELQLNIYYQNVRGLRTKTHNFYRNLCCSQYDVIILTETWIDRSVFSAELFDDRYTVFRRDRETTGFHHDKRAGGVLIAVSKKFNARRIGEWESSCEDLWVKIGIDSNSNYNIALCAVYLPPPVSRVILNTFTENCNKILEHVENNVYPMIVGDFNLSQI